MTCLFEKKSGIRTGSPPSPHTPGNTCARYVDPIPPIDKISIGEGRGGGGGENNMGVEWIRPRGGHQRRVYDVEKVRKWRERTKGSNC